MYLRVSPDPRSPRPPPPNACSRSCCCLVCRQLVLNPFYEASTPITSSAFDLRVRTIARKYGLSAS